MNKKTKKDDILDFNGVILKELGHLKFQVNLEGDRVIIAHLSGKLKNNKIKITQGDKVRVEFSLYDLNNGRIVYRY